jgi:outer membrane protein OmpA-like peptidoglycan-associated protein
MDFDGASCMCARFGRKSRGRGAARQRHAQSDEVADRPPRAPSQGARPGVPIFLKTLAATSTASRDAASEAIELAQHDPGHPLDAATRHTMESQLGHDLGAVRIRTGADAADAARGVGARAYAAGTHVVFGAGEYAPSTTDGQSLLAHELTHVVQQSVAPTHGATTAEPSVSQPSDPLEHAADHAAERMTRGEPSTAQPPTPVASPRAATSAPTPAIQRQPLPTAEDLTLRPSPTTARLLGSLTLDGFALDSAALTGAHRAALAGLAISLQSLLRSYPTGTLSVTGHTDATGSEAHNVGLGEQRAAAVTAVLIAERVPSDIISTSSAGESQPREPTPQASPRNRRVEIHFEPEQRWHLVEPLKLSEEKSSPPVDLFPPSVLRPETPTEQMERILQPIPEVPPGPTVSQALLEHLDRQLNKAMEKLGVPEKFRPYVRDAAHSALKGGVEKLRDLALDQLPMGAQEKEALRKAAEAAVQTPLR